MQEALGGVFLQSIELGLKTARHTQSLFIEDVIHHRQSCLYLRIGEFLETIPVAGQVLHKQRNFGRSGNESMNRMDFQTVEAWCTTTGITTWRGTLSERLRSQIPTMYRSICRCG